MGQASSKQIYRPLNRDQKEIRVLWLFGPRNAGLIRAELKHVSLDAEDRPKYQAISYCWAEVPGYDYIMIDGIIFKAPASAVKVLHQFQPDEADHYQVLWIDALCINQDDISERSHQVQIMGDIYRQCDEALIWLGDYDESVDQAIKSFELLLDDLVSRTSGFDSFFQSWQAGAWEPDPETDDAYSNALIDAGLDLEALITFFLQPWFSRLWVFQEACLPRAAMCIRSHVGIYWSQLCGAISWLSEKYRMLRMGMEIPMAAHLAMRFGWKFIEYQERRPSLDALTRLLPIAANLEASEPIDKAFAILGLTDWQTNASLWPKGFAVDYSQPRNKIFAYLYRAAMAHDGELSQLPWGGVTAQLGQDTSRSASWFPDYRTRFDNSFSNASIFWGPFNADMKQPLSLDDLRDAESPEVLSLQGISLGAVETVLPVMDANNESMYTIAAFRSFFLTSMEKLGLGEPDDHLKASKMLGRTMTIGGTIDVGLGVSVEAKDENDFIQGLSNFLRQTDGQDECTKIADPLESWAFDFAAYATTICLNRRLFKTSKGYFGLGPATTQLGDSVAILFGSRVPFVVRSERNQDQSLPDGRFLLNGECYIHGIMFGEAVKEHLNAGLPISSFSLV